ncbi:MAG TPA: quinolinate synthase NadA, partial [Chroococcales cyanobacterium]
MSEVSEISRLARERDAVILAHVYQRPEIHEVADFVGDSLELSRMAAQTAAREIYFCGVHFMAETAALLSPEKTVVLPEPMAGCPMADMAEVDFLRAWKGKNPGIPVVAYVNTSAAIKAESDICCTSSNAVEIVASLSVDEVLLLPDAQLGRHVAQQLPSVKVHLWPGCCPTHLRIEENWLLEEKKLFPEAFVLAHPECSAEVLALADFVGSTSAMIREVKKNPSPRFIVATENGIEHPLRLQNPDKLFRLSP